MSKKILDVAQTATRFGVSEKSIRRHAVELHGFYLGQRLLFSEEGLDAFIESHQLASRRGRKGSPLRKVG